MLRKTSKIIVVTVLLTMAILLPCAFAAVDTSSLGKLSSNLLEPVGIVSRFVKTACFLGGGSFLFASIIKYIEHRRSPLMVPISTVVFLFIAGIVLILLPLAAYISENGLHYTFLK